MKAFIPADFDIDFGFSCGFCFVAFVTVALVKGRFEFNLGSRRRAASSAGMVDIRSRLAYKTVFVLPVTVGWSFSLDWMSVACGDMYAAILKAGMVVIVFWFVG